MVAASFLDTKIAYLYEIKKNNYSCVFRGVDDERKELLVDPTKWHRRSKENSNHYTLWIDNNDSWAGYPLRSKSIICATSDRIARNFSTYVFDVWPLDQDAVFGMCPASDIWNSINIKFNTDGDIDDVRQCWSAPSTPR